MKHTGRYHFDPVKGPAAKRRFRPKPLKSLSTSQIWRLIESIEDELKSAIFYSQSHFKALKKRHRDLSAELDDRIKYDEWLCEIADLEEARTNPLGLDRAIEEFRKSEENPPRKSLGKVYIKKSGKRLRPGPKIDYKRSHRKVA
jgi:hypothetical protein